MNVDMREWQQRTELLLGTEKMNRLRQAHVLVVGLGGVGAYAAEMICRAGVGRMTIVDADTVQPTNINRQLPALHSTVGQPKVEVLAKRFLDINPEVKLTLRPEYLFDQHQRPPDRGAVFLLPDVPAESAVQDVRTELEGNHRLFPAPSQSGGERGIIDGSPPGGRCSSRRPELLSLM